MNAAEELASLVGTAPACEALAVPRASLYRRRIASGKAEPPAPRGRPARSLTEQERIEVRAVLDSGRFVDRAPAEIYATLLDEGTYLCSIRTMYRVLAESGEVGERRNQLQHPQYHKPELLAIAPNQVWSWDITKLLGPAKWTYFYLYVILDVFSRYVVGWMLASRECADLAKRLISETICKQQVNGEALIIHSDRGPSMKSHGVAQLLATLGVTKSHSRPHVSNDNPFSESQFKTMKYRPDFPDRFSSFEDAHGFCTTFFQWYNVDHRHWGIALLTPEMVHYGRAAAALDARQTVLDAAYTAHPERFVHRPPSPLAMPTAVWINPPREPNNDHRHHEALIETIASSGGCPPEIDLTGSRLTHDLHSGRLQTPAHSVVSLNNRSTPAGTEMKVHGGSRGEGPRVPPIPGNTGGEAAPCSSDQAQHNTSYTNSQWQLSQSR